MESLLKLTAIVDQFKGNDSKFCSFLATKFITFVLNYRLVEGTDMFSFTGIPYAIPLNGTQRWTHSRPIASLEDCHEGTLLAHSKSLVSNFRASIDKVVVEVSFSKALAKI